MSTVQMGSLRSELNALREQAEDARRTKDGLRSDNLRLTHRITYLEEQVAELLDRNRDRDPDAEVNLVCCVHPILTLPKLTLSCKIFNLNNICKLRWVYIHLRFIRQKA